MATIAREIPDSFTDDWYALAGTTEPRCPDCGARMKYDLEMDVWICTGCKRTEL